MYCIGNRVYWHCTDDTSTTCGPCPEFTFSDEPNGHMKCLPCTVCNGSQGLRVNKACTQSSDTVCGPLKRFYCIDKMKGSCISAVQHSECSLGQYIKQEGTASTDTVCADCTGDTYSMDRSHPVYHTQNVRTWDLRKQIQEHILLTQNVEIPILM